mgnify:CR=1 FL=1
MSPMIRYTLARLGLFCLAAGVLLALPIGLHVLLRLAVAVLLAAVAAHLLLRGLRDQVAVQLSGAAGRRADRRRRLHAALAGEDPPDAMDGPDAGTDRVVPGQ